MAKQQSMSFYEFKDTFRDNDKCRKYLASMRWVDGFICPMCGCNEYYSIRKRHLYQCKLCKYQASVTSGAVMHRSHLPLTTWFWAIYLVAKDKRGYSAMQLSRELKLSYDTAWFLLHRIRKAMSHRDSQYSLFGVIELDDTYFGKTHRGAKRGRGTSKIKVVAAISKDAKGKPQCLKMRVVPNLKGKTIGQFAQENIAEESVVQTDDYHSYRKPLSEKYVHQHQKFNASSGNLKWLHTVIGNAKSFVAGTFHGLGHKHMQSYLDEFCYRFSRRFAPCELFARLVCAVMNSEPLSFAELTQ